MSKAIETGLLARLQAQTLLRFLERKGLGLSQGDPVKEIWADVAAFANGTRDLCCLTDIVQRNKMSACNAVCVGLNHGCVNAGVFLALYGFCREDEGYRPAATIPWIAHALAFRAGRSRCTNDEQRLLFAEFDDEIETAYQAAGMDPIATGLIWPVQTPRRTKFTTEPGPTPDGPSHPHAADPRNDEAHHNGRAP